MFEMDLSFVYKKSCKGHFKRFTRIVISGISEKILKYVVSDFVSFIYINSFMTVKKKNPKSIKYFLN